MGMRNRVLRIDGHIRLIIVLLLAGAFVLSGIGVRNIVAAPTPAPILLVVNDAAPNHFGGYVGEILRTEGLNAFDVAQVSSVTSSDLTQHKLAVLAETSLTSAQVTLFTNYVNGGGRLLALRPTTQIASLFGLTSLGTTQTDGYLAINAGQLAGQGLPGATLQIHGASDRYTLNGATP